MRSDSCILSNIQQTQAEIVRQQEEIKEILLRTQLVPDGYNYHDDDIVRGGSVAMYIFTQFLFCFMLFLALIAKNFQ